jgi:hypothetical protein
MSNVLPTLIGLTCLTIPAITIFGMGWVFGARYGTPLRIEWKGLRDRSDDDD